MVEDSDLRRDLLWRIETRRAAIQAFLRQQRPRTRRRINATIILSSLAALFTAGPAVGGETFAEGVQGAFGLDSDAYVWRVLCLLALVVSVSAAILTNIGKSEDDVAKVAAAEAANAELEGLTTLVRYGHLSVDDAVKLYQQYSSKILFIDDLPVAAGTGPGGYGPGGYAPGGYGPGGYGPPQAR